KETGGRLELWDDPANLSLPVDGILKEILDEVNGGKRFQGGKDKTGTLSERDRYIFDEIAQYYGYSSGDAMAQAIIDNPSLQEAAEQWADKYMEQNYGARESAESIQRKAVEAIFNEKNLERIALEYQIIFKMMTRSADFSGLESIKINRSEIDLYKRYAAQTLAGKSVKESTNYRIYLTAERRMAQRSQRGIDNKDFVEASRAKRQQLINAALAREAMRNRVEIEKKIKRFESFLRQKKVSAAYGDIRHLYILLEKAGINTKGENSELITIANQMLKEGAKEWEIRNNTGYIADEDGNLHKESLKEFANRMEDDYTPLLIADNIMDGSAIKPYKEMLLEDFRNLADAFESIKTAGHNRNRFINEARQQTISQAAAETADSIVKNAGVKFEDDKLIGHKNTTMAAGIFNRLKELPDRFLDSLANLPTICKILDGGAVNGAAMRNIYRPLQEANRREKERHIKIQKDIQALLAKHYPNNEIAKYKSQRYKIYIKRIDRNLYMEEILAMALNFGNEQNISRMHNFETIVDGDLLKLDAGDIHECLEHLKKNDWEFVQGVWDYLDSFWAEIASLERSVNGFIPKRVEPSPFSVKTADGHIVKMRGGYYPISYDPQKSIEADRHNEMKNALFKQFSTAAAQTEQGHTKARVRNVNRAIKLDTSVLFNHLDNVVHDLEFRKAVIDTNKFLNQNEVKEAISDALGIRGYRMIRETLKATASEQGETLSDFQRPVNWLRQKTVLYYLGYRLAALPRDIAGNIAIAMHEQGAGGWISGMLSFAKDWRQNIGIVDEKSVMMKNRRLLKDRDFWEMSKKIFISSNFAKVRNEFTQKAFMFQAWADTMHAYPLWLQTYKEALVKIKQDGRLIEEFGLGKTEAEKEPLPDIDYGTDLNTGESAAPAKQEMPQDDFYQNPEGDFRLPDLNSADLDLMKKENKPVILKKNIVERNDKKHSDIRGQENKIISEALYKPDLILQSKKELKPNYYTFVKINDDSSIVLLEMSDEKDNFEVVHYYKVDRQEVERLLAKTRQEDGQSLITNRINPKWAADLSALLPGNENIAKKVEEYVERMAVLAADEAVIRTFGGGSAVDLAQIQRGGEYQKLFTMFYSFAGAIIAPIVKTAIENAVIFSFL
ncbi:MAG: hypothetical protein LBH29_06480, partial [Elusimicrobiota bacterium]|nr:hypothetical protein [Elusimicrobiota bacterium]